VHLLFLHGPGLNTEAERRALAPALARNGVVADFWNEPSGLRPDGPAFRPEPPPD
jgi:hypothetical protein